MRIVMPLFDFHNEDSQEFQFDSGNYSLQKFDHHEIPQCDLFSEYDVENMVTRSWALVAEQMDVDKYEQEVNILLLSFRICRSARVFIKYHLCKENIRLCRRVCNTMRVILPEESRLALGLNDLEVINEGFKNLLDMETVSNRTHNAGYFLFRGFCSDKMIDSFVLLMMALESLFSSEERAGVTKTICSRISNFLDHRPRCRHEDILKLYDLRSKIVHGKLVVGDDIKGQFETLYDLQYVTIQCMRKMLGEKIYLIYGDVDKKERYFKALVKE